MNWIPLETLQQLHDIKNGTGYSLIFKHSTRCSISMMARKRLEQDKEYIPAETAVYFLDLIRYRDISSAVADIFDVYHESPQLLVIKDGECIYHASHGNISGDIAGALIS